MKVKDRILIFGGTTEGRELSDILRSAGIPHAVSVATEYGAEILSDSGEEDLIVGRKSAEEIAQMLKAGLYSAVVDATHPFAVTVSQEIRNACEAENVRYMRLSRDTGEADAGSDVVYAGSIEEAADHLEKCGGNILLLTGSKDLGAITKLIGDTSRIYARVLPEAKSLEKCEEAGLKGRQIIAMQGPFSTQMNIALIRQTGASAVLTKESGKTGGFDEKLEASRACGVPLVVLANPEKKDDFARKYTMEEIMRNLSESTGIKIEEKYRKNTVTLAGIGPGDDRFRTSEFIRCLEKTDVIFGAKTVVDRLENLTVPVYKTYLANEILEVLKDHPEYKSPMVVFSGDISLCSGAKKAAGIFTASGYEVKRISGISSVTLFAERLGLSLEEVRIISAHGRKCNVASYAECEKKLIVLPSGMTDALEICNKLKAIPRGDEGRFLVKIGYELGSDNERIIDAFKADEELFTLKGKCLIYIENHSAPGRKVGAGIRDDEMIRGEVPMTKEEVRALSIKKLELTGESVLYDIGAGTGSVSIEAAGLSPDIEVYAIDRSTKALELIAQNREKHSADNVHIVEGEAPEALKDLPVPTHVFIGGSGGRLSEIVAAVREKNKDARIVINCIALETLSEVVNVAGKFKYMQPDVIQVSINRFRKVGKYNISDAQNPVYIIRL